MTLTPAEQREFNRLMTALYGGAMTPAGCARWDELKAKATGEEYSRAGADALAFTGGGVAGLYGTTSEVGMIDEDWLFKRYGKRLEG